jgi:hypothetical protein
MLMNFCFFSRRERKGKRRCKEALSNYNKAIEMYKETFSLMSSTSRGLIKRERS